ncbi:MAG: ATP-grasp domain-containing protein [Tumebacillaceae bacterium]
MSILIMSKMAYAQAPYDDWLQDLEEDLIVLTTPDHAAQGQNYHHVEAFGAFDTNPCIEVRAMELAEEHDFRVIFGPSECDLLRAARLRETLGIKGQSYESALAFRDKTVMKTYLKQAGIRVPHFAKIHSALDIYQFIQQHGYPVVVKPVDGIGSKNTAVLRNRNDLISYLQEDLATNLEVETFVEGEMYHVDGLILNGEIVLIWPSKYTTGCLAFQDGTSNGSYLLGAENPMTARLIDYVKQVLGALPTPEHVSFHAEVFHTPQDELVFCEIAGRTGGGHIRQAFKTGFGVDLNQISVQAQCGIKFDSADFATGAQVPRQYCGFLMVPSKKGVLRKVPEGRYADWVTQSKITAAPNQVFNGSVSSADTIGLFFVEGESEEQVISRLQELTGWLERSFVWE